VGVPILFLTYLSFLGAVPREKKKEKRGTRGRSLEADTRLFHRRNAPRKKSFKKKKKKKKTEEVAVTSSMVPSARARSSHGGRKKKGKKKEK